MAHRSPIQGNSVNCDTVFVHLLNDFSGSPRVLRSVMRVATEAGRSCKLYVGSEGDGLLTDAGVPIARFWYRRSRWRVLKLATYLASQCLLLLRLFADRGISRGAILYVNTLLPFGAMLYGRLTGRPVIVHLHEVSLSPRLLQRALTAIVRICATSVIYVSDAHRRALPVPGVPSIRIHNIMDAELVESARSSHYRHSGGDAFLVLMVASLRDYKGIPEFMALSEDLEDEPTIRFRLVLNETERAIEALLRRHRLPANVEILGRTRDLGPHYRQASLLLNLSRVDQWVETFGLTLLEAMAHGVPVIAPPVGGPAEIITDGRQGLLIDSRDRTALADAVRRLAHDKDACLSLSAAARERSLDFDEDGFATLVRSALSDPWIPHA